MLIQMHQLNQFKLTTQMLAYQRGLYLLELAMANVNAAHLERLEKAAKDGVVVVRSSRVPTGYTTRDAEV